MQQGPRRRQRRRRLVRRVSLSAAKPARRPKLARVHSSRSPTPPESAWRRASAPNATLNHLTPPSPPTYACAQEQPGDVSTRPLRPARPRSRRCKAIQARRMLLEAPLQSACQQRARLTPRVPQSLPLARATSAAPLRSGVMTPRQEQPDVQPKEGSAVPRLRRRRLQPFHAFVSKRPTTLGACGTSSVTIPAQLSIHLRQSGDASSVTAPDANRNSMPAAAFSSSWRRMQHLDPTSSRACT